MNKFFSKPDTAWLISAAIASALLAASIFLPLWRMELIAPQYPSGLAIWAFGNGFVGDTSGYYESFDTLLEINNLNHYIGMKPIEEVWAMDIFIPGLALTILGAILTSFIAWNKRFFQALMALAFWTIPVFFIVVLQYYLYDFGHTMKGDAALAMDPFTPKVIGSTSVWNFHTNNSFQIGFLLMVLSALTITFLPIIIRRLRARHAQSITEPTRQTASDVASMRGRTA
ncbi:MAG: hypothetical protein ABIP58_04640 [Dehalococcoidia bacterium]